MLKNQHRLLCGIALDHNDLVPNNIIVESGRTLRLIDWGDAAYCDPNYALARLVNKSILPPSLLGNGSLYFDSDQRTTLQSAYIKALEYYNPHLESSLAAWTVIRNAILTLGFAAKLIEPRAPHRWRPPQPSLAKVALLQYLEEQDYPLPRDGSGIMS